jgi:type VI secretion system secreted protein VgrG
MHDYPGTPAWHGDKLDDGDLTARVGARLQELQVAAVRARGHGNSRGIATGCLFKLDAPDGRGGKHPRADQNDEHLVVSAEHEITDSSDTSGSGGSFGYEVDFQAIPSSVQYRPPRVTRKPFIQGPQTATVTGPDGDDKIHTDKQGRIQVQFHWARPAGDDGATGKPSCYLRVAQIWAGPKYGAFMLPRIGHEVVVSFLEGDPDRPLVTGSVYNGDNQAPFPLPGEKTKSGLRTRSSTGGGDADCNEFVFEDKKGDEFVLLHAQKDLTVEVENNETRTVDKNRKTEIKEEDEEKVGANQKLEVVKNQTLKVSGDQSVAVEGKQEVKVTKDQTTDVTQNQTVTITQKYKLKANQEIAFECGASKITMKPDGTIKIEGVQIKIAGMASVDVHADAQVNVTGLMVGIKGDVQTEVKGLMINLSGDAMAMLKGAITMIG